MKNACRAALIAVMLCLSVHAQQALSGAWEGTTPGRQSVRLELTATGAALTGTMIVGGQKATLENGKTSKNTFSFTVTMEGGTEGFSGEVAGDQLKMWMDDRGPAAAITLTRSTASQK